MMSPFLKEIFMSVFLLRFERAARYLLGFLTALVLFAMLAFQMGWVSKQPGYDAFGWYTVMQHHNAKVIRQVDSEAACRSREHAPAVLCRQGRMLNAELFANR